MSRGLSRQQQSILQALEDAGESGEVVLELAEKIHGVQWPTPAQYESVRRAVKSLIKRGLICAGPMYMDRKQLLWEGGRESWHNRYIARAHTEALLRRKFADDPERLSGWLAVI